MDDEPRFFGDVYPPDDPRPGDVWLSNGVYRIRFGDGWQPPIDPPAGGEEYRAYKSKIRSEISRRYWARWHAERERNNSIETEEKIVL